MNVVYETTNLVNNRKYIGVCTHDNPNYLGSGKALKHALKKYGKDNFAREDLHVCETSAEAYQLEEQLIDECDAINSSEYYNMMPGGKGGDSAYAKAYWSQFTAEERKSVRNWNPVSDRDQSYTKCPDFLRKRSETIKSIWSNRSTKEQQAIANKVSHTRKSTGVAKGEKNPMHGRSAITEQKLRWYTNGQENLYITEGTQPSGYWNGRANISGKIGKRANQ